MRFLVELHQYRTGTVFVDAGDEDEAVEKGEKAATDDKVAWDPFEVEVLDVTEKGGETHGQEGKDRQEGKEGEG